MLFNKILKNKKILLLIDIILLIVSISCYKYIYDIEKIKAIYAAETVKFVEENKNPIFSVNKIVLYSSAYAVDNTEEQNMQDIDISQFTDIAIYIDNKGESDEITAENTINEMFIDNIKLQINSDKGEHILNYKNPETFGKYVEIPNYQEDGMMFKIIHSNEQKEDVEENESVFFTDCSNPISLGFINKNIMTDCSIGNINGQISFDGSILRNANIDLDSISGKISFSIHIRNNLDESFICNLNIDNVLEEDENGIYSGYVMKIENFENNKIPFLKVQE